MLKMRFWASQKGNGRARSSSESSGGDFPQVFAEWGPQRIMNNASPQNPGEAAGDQRESGRGARPCAPTGPFLCKKGPTGAFFIRRVPRRISPLTPRGGYPTDGRDCFLPRLRTSAASGELQGLVSRFLRCRTGYRGMGTRTIGSRGSIFVGNPSGGTGRRRR